MVRIDSNKYWLPLQGENVAARGHRRRRETSLAVLRAEAVARCGRIEEACA